MYSSSSILLKLRSVEQRGLNIFVVAAAEIYAPNDWRNAAELTVLGRIKSGSVRQSWVQKLICLRIVRVFRSQVRRLSAFLLSNYFEISTRVTRIFHPYGRMIYDDIADETNSKASVIADFWSRYRVL